MRTGLVEKPKREKIYLLFFLEIVAEINSDAYLVEETGQLRFC